MSTVEVPRPPRVVPRMPGGELALEPPPEPERPVPAGAPRPVAPGGDAGGLGRLRRPGSARTLVGPLRRHVRTVDRRDAARRRRRTQRRVSGRRRSTRSGATTCATWPRPGVALRADRHRAAGGPGTRPPGSRGVARRCRRRQAGCGSAVVRDPDFGLLRVGTGAQRLATTLDRPADRPRRGARAGHRPRPAPLPARTRGGSRAAGRAVAPRHLRDLARARTGCRPEHVRALARALVAQYVLWHGPADALLAVVAPPYLAPEWEWVEVAPARRPPAGHRRRRTGADGHGGGGRRPAVVGGRACRPDARRRAGGATPARGRRRRGRPRLVGRRRGDDGAPRRCPAGSAAHTCGGAPPRRSGRTLLGGRCGHRRGRRAARRVLRRGGVGAGPSPRPLPARRLGLHRRPGHGGRPPRAARAGPSGARCASGGDHLRRRRRTACAPRPPCRGPVARTGRRRRGGRAGGAGPQGVRRGRQRSARPLVGATGSGKSELLRTLVLGLVATHSSAI